MTLYLKPLKENDKLIQISKCPQNENNTLIPQKKIKIFKTDNTKILLKQVEEQNRCRTIAYKWTLERYKENFPVWPIYSKKCQSL